ncbi:vanin-like protein 1 isoform X1 [Lycorma delicatula]|uniref:vanin-like protein 1 isoform X1 n=1 Tax=Lycorma delicatula TaxID=130591 RepID=UPI003F5115EF
MHLHNQALVFITGLIFVYNNYLSAVLAEDNYFTGAVVEYSPEYLNTSELTVFKNIENYGDIVKRLKTSYSELQIVVFPEAGITSLEWLRGNESNIYTEVVPSAEDKNTPCLTNSSGKALTELCYIAKNNSVYLVVNLIEKYINNDTTKYFNTDVVFNKNGTVIARYRKYNLYGAGGLSKPDKNDTIQYFDTDFGVKFGIFTCFDILFKTPALELVDASHIVFPTAWYSELPFLTAIQEQSAWSYATNKVLMASNYNNPAKGCTGSGIYFGQLSDPKTINQRSLQTQVDGTFAIISNIPKNLSVPVSVLDKFSKIQLFYDEIPKLSQAKMKTDYLDVYKTEPVTEAKVYELQLDFYHTLVTNNTINKTVCYNEFCCTFFVKFKTYYVLDIDYVGIKNKGDHFGAFNYRFSAFSGVRNHGNNYATTGIQVCSIIPCMDNSGSGSCGKRTDDISPESVTYLSSYKFIKAETQFDDIQIIARFNTTVKDSFVTANILVSSDNWDRDMIDYQRFGIILDPSYYSVTEQERKQYVFSQKQIINNPGTVSLYNRIFDWDGQEPTKVNSACSLNKMSSVILMLISVMIFVKLFLIMC